MPRDYYDVLGISKGADSKEIKSAFRKLARQYHPDVSQEPDAEDKFKEINEAYEVLSNDEKRARYDRFGHAGVGGASGGYDQQVMQGLDLRIFSIFSIVHSAVHPRVQVVGVVLVQGMIGVLM